MIILKFNKSNNKDNYRWWQCRISQRGLSKNGTEWVAQEVQLELEQNDALTPLTAPPSVDMKVVLLLSYYPATPASTDSGYGARAGKAYVDYPIHSVRKEMLFHLPAALPIHDLL